MVNLTPPTCVFVAQLARRQCSVWDRTPRSHRRAPNEVPKDRYPQTHSSIITPPRRPYTRPGSGNEDRPQRGLTLSARS